MSRGLGKKPPLMVTPEFDRMVDGISKAALSREAELRWRRSYQHWPHRFSGCGPACADCGEPRTHVYHGRS